MSGVILLAGGTGMVGRNVRDLAAQRDIDVAAPARTEMDLLDPDSIAAAIARIKPDIIVHAAGRVGGIAANMDDPLHFLTDNFDMGRNLMMAAHAAGVPRLINLGSSCMYPRDMERPLTEDDVLGGPLEPTNEAYAIAKSAVARLGQYLSAEHADRDYKTLIPCNLYGRYDAYDPGRSHVAAAAIAKVHAAVQSGAREVEIWGSGTARREFLYAGDLADAILRAVNHFDTLPPLTNIGVGTDVTINDYYRAAAEVIGFDGRFVHDLDRPVGMKRKLMDVGRATAWGWTAKTALKDGIAQAHAWYRAEIAEAA